MIEIRLDDRNFTLEAKGHALETEGPEWKYICSNVSTLTQGLAYSLTKYEKEHESIRGMDYRPEPGDLLLKVDPEEWARAAVRKRMQNFGDALEMLAQCESSYIHMVWNGEEIRGIMTEEETDDE